MKTMTEIETKQLCRPGRPRARRRSGIKSWYYPAALALVFVAGTLAAGEMSQHRSGAIVEVAEKGLAADKAGIQPGDEILSWRRPPAPPANLSPAQGAFRTSFDLLGVEVDQAPRGRVQIELVREGKRLSIWIPPGRWGLEVRPRLLPGDLAKYLKGQRLLAGGDTTAAVAVWRDLAAGWQKDGRREDAAWLQATTGEAFCNADMSEESLVPFGDAVENARAVGRLDIAAMILRAEALALESPRKTDSLVSARESLSLREADCPSGLGSARALLDLAMFKDPNRDEFARRALSIYELHAPDSLERADCLRQLAVSANERGEFQASIELGRAALKLTEQLDPGGEANIRVLQNLASHLSSLGEFATADEYSNRAVQLLEARDPTSLGLAALLQNTGGRALAQGDLDRAEHLLRRANVIRQKRAPVSPDMAKGLLALADILIAKRDFDEAERLLARSQEVADAIQAGDRIRGDVVGSLATIAFERGDFSKAEKLHREALAFYEARRPGGTSSSNERFELARVLAREKRWEEAEGIFRQALAEDMAGSPQGKITSEDHHELGRLLSETGRRIEANAEFGHAVDDLEAQQGLLADDPETKSAFYASRLNYYEDHIALLMELGYRTQAFDMLERSRARLLLEMLSKRDLPLDGEIPAETEKERKVVDADYEGVQEKIRTLNPKNDAQAIEQSLARLSELRARRAAILEQINKASPRYASVRYPQPLGLAAVRESLDPGTLLLAYSVGPEHAFLFAVEPAGASGPGLTAFQIGTNETLLRQEVEAFRSALDPRPSSAAGSRLALSSRSSSLYELLVKPAEPLIARYERMLVLPDGPLHTLPLAALVRRMRDGRTQYLGEWKPIHTAVSATVYAALREARKSATRDPAVVVAAFGDPQYPKLPEARVAAKRSEGDGLTADDDDYVVADPELRSAARRGFRFEPLPASRKEVEAIVGLYAPRSAAYLGANATEEKAKAIGKDVAIIHFACHAVINERFPLDSALVFTIPEHPKEGQDNGLLQAWEIFESMRIDADLVTLSACDSGLGKEMGGEGLIGLTRAFQYAGARSVLASLWKVEDQSTADLMKRFYGYLKSGKTKDEALRLAQINLIHSPNFSQPKDWAAFELIGDWK